MGWGAPMESYEEFCLQTLALLRNEGKFKKLPCEPLCTLKTQSVICFHGRTILPPQLTAEQRQTMCKYRQQAVQLEVQNQSRQRNRLIARVQDLLDQTQIKTTGAVGKAPRGKSPTISGYTLVTDSLGLTKDSGCDYLAASYSNTPIVTCNKEEEVEQARTEDKSEEEDDDDEEDISLDSLLKKSREYVKQEQKIVHTPAPENSLEINNKNSNTSKLEFGFSLRHSPVGPSKTQNQPPLEVIYPQLGPLSPVSPDQHVNLPAKDPCPSQSVPKRRPRPISTGNIHFAFPIEPADLVPRSPGRRGEGVSDWDMFLNSAKSSRHRASLGEDYRDGVKNGQTSQWSTMEPCSPSNAKCSPNGHLDSTQFRRRCHTLDSQPQSNLSATERIDRSQERVPRFMAGVTWLGPNRRLPVAPVNPCCNPEYASTSKPSVSPDSHNALLNKPEAQPRTENTQRQTQAVEDRQRYLEDEHALQMAQLLAEQEREQQRLLLEYEQAERRLKEQLRRPLSADASGWNHRLGCDPCPIMSPSCPRLSPAHTPSERSPGHNLGFLSPAISPSVQSSITTWGPSWTGSKPQARLSKVMTPDQHRAHCRITAIARGFLTRRLLKIEKIKNLRQTVVDTQEFIRSLQTEVPPKKVSYSTQDLSLQERVRAQLRAALYDIHDIFFQMPLSQRLALLQQDRELRLERKLRDMEKTKSTKDKVVLSAATQRSIDRKKRVGESPAQTRKMQPKPKSPTTNRVLRPNQGQNSPSSGQLNRQGSWYKKTPEERLRRADSLKKQHSLG